MILKLFAAVSLVGLIGVIQSDTIDSWAKLTAVPVLGAIIVAQIVVTARERKTTLEAHGKQWSGVSKELRGIRDDLSEGREKQLELLRACLQSKNGD
ncbi:MAG: hypothetical protein AAFX06_32225 [Planctomycetota bacterium]